MQFCVFTGQYECVQNIAGCSHYCETNKDNATVVCFCPPGYSLSSGTTCICEYNLSASVDACLHAYVKVAIYTFCMSQCRYLKAKPPFG